MDEGHGPDCQCCWLLSRLQKPLVGREADEVFRCVLASPADSSPRPGRSRTGELGAARQGPARLRASRSG